MFLYYSDSLSYSLLMTMVTKACMCHRFTPFLVEHLRRHQHIVIIPLQCVFRGFRFQFILKLN